jgi:hypothetical protein
MVEEHEPIETHLRVEMSPPPTRLYRWDAGIGQRNVCAGRRMQDLQFGHPAGGLERASLDQTTRDDLRQARIKTAIGNLARVIESRHVN